MNYYIEAFKKYAVFEGRATRKEYWMFVLFNLIINIGLSMIESRGNNLLSSLYGLVVFLPSLAVGIRRLHDVDRRGWFILIPIYNLILLCTQGTKGANRFGSDPREVVSVGQSTPA